MLEIQLLEPSSFEWNHDDNVNMNSYAGVHNRWMYYKAPHELKIFLFWISQNLAGPRSDLMSKHLLNNAFVEATCKVHVFEKETHAVWILNYIFKIPIHWCNYNTTITCTIWPRIYTFPLYSIKVVKSLNLFEKSFYPLYLSNPLLCRYLKYD